MIYIILIKLNLMYFSQNMTKKPTNDLYTQRRLRSALATAQSNKSLLSAWRKLVSFAIQWAHNEYSVQSSLGSQALYIYFFLYI